MMLNKIKNGTLTIKDFDQRNQLTNYIINHLSTLKLVNKGTVGKVYEIGQYVVKQIRPCIKKNNRYCTDLYKPIYAIPSSSTFRYVIPNLLSEIVIGTMINSPFTARTITSFILNENEIYIVI